MRQSKLFTKTKKENPKDEVSLNAQLLIRGGFVYKEMAGVYAFLPLGLRVIEKIKNIIRKEMNLIGGQEIALTALQNPESWKKSGRWDDDILDVWFKTKLKNETEVGLGATHEEPLTELMKNYISSYKDLPVYAYQFQTKFRNETRAKSGIMRGREFLMKDLYSFNESQEDLDFFYEKAKKAYANIFKKVGIGEDTYITFASGGSFSKYSHEFQTISKAGEDIIYIDKDKKIAINKEVYNNDVLNDLNLDKEKLIQEKSIEVGNIFKLGTKFSETIGLNYLNKEGNKKLVFMGCYGIGPGRLMGVITELKNDDRGIIWPEEIAPFKVHLISLKKNKEAEVIYNNLKEKGIEVFYDDREDVSAGEKFADSDLIGCPLRIVVSEKTLVEESVEIKKRKEKESSLIKTNNLIQFLLKN